jgi:acid stress-induced BolA-like protein IbaG/YrbA
MLQTTTQPQAAEQNPYAFSLSTGMHSDYFKSLQEEWLTLPAAQQCAVMEQVKQQLQNSIRTLDIAIQKEGEKFWEKGATEEAKEQAEAKKQRFIKARQRIENQLSAIEDGSL